MAPSSVFPKQVEHGRTWCDVVIENYHRAMEIILFGRRAHQNRVITLQQSENEVSVGAEKVVVYHSASAVKPPHRHRWQRPSDPVTHSYGTSPAGVLVLRQVCKRRRRSLVMSMLCLACDTRTLLRGLERTLVNALHALY